MRANAQSLLNAISSMEEQLARLKAAVSSLEARLEPQNEPLEADVWDVWPYSWLIHGAQKARECFHSFHEKQEQRSLAAHNRQQQKQFAGEPTGELTLI